VISNPVAIAVGVVFELFTEIDEAIMGAAPNCLDPKAVWPYMPGWKVPSGAPFSPIIFLALF
jgi:hypothetical protein